MQFCEPPLAPDPGDATAMSTITSKAYTTKP